MIPIPLLATVGGALANSLPEFHCGTPDAPEASMLDKIMGRERMCKWPTTDLSYGFKSYLPGLGEKTQRKISRAVSDVIEAACGVRWTEAPASSATVVIGSGRGPRANFDGPGGVLAWAELPCGAQRQVEEVFDLDEKWVEQLGNQAVLQILYFAVDLHERLHAMGVPHAPANVAGTNIMAPVYSPKVAALGPWDVQQLQLRYGPPAAKPPVQPPVNPPTLPSFPVEFDWATATFVYAGKSYGLTPKAG